MKGASRHGDSSHVPGFVFPQFVLVYPVAQDSQSRQVPVFERWCQSCFFFSSGVSCGSIRE